MFDRIVHDNIQEFINQMVPFHQSPSEMESVNYKKCSRNIFTTKSAYTMGSIKQMFHKMFQNNNSIQNGINNNKYPLVA